MSVSFVVLNGHDEKMPVLTKSSDHIERAVMECGAVALQLTLESANGSVPSTRTVCQVQDTNEQMA